MPLNSFKKLVKSLLVCGNTHDVLRLYMRSYCSDYLKTESLEILIDCITETAREILREKKFSADSFFCPKCNEIIKDPVTLKCGHTFSKKCVISETKNDTYSCLKCNEKYSFSYLSQLKNSVTVLSLVEKLHDGCLLRYKGNSSSNNENPFNKLHEADTYIIERHEQDVLSEAQLQSFVLHATTSSGFFKKGNLLLSFGNFEEALKAYLTCLTLDSSDFHAKRAAIKILHSILQNYPHSLSPCPNSLSMQNRSLFLKKSLSENNLRCSGSSDSLHVVREDLSSSDEDEVNTELNKYSDRTDLYLMLDTFFDYIKKIGEERSILPGVDAACLDKKEFECPLCMRLLWEPVTTTCGHTFCRVCLNRCFDHQPTCPLCKSSLATFLAERVQNTTEILELAIKHLLPRDYAERQTSHEEEMEQLTNAGKDPEHEIPLFVCTVALPTVPCPLHVFEPRYRLMIRQCMESGSRQFGMCGVVDDEIAEYGTMLEIREVQYFPDGRSIVDAIGRKRFRILRRGERDGYHTGAVEFLEDQPLTDMDLECIEEKHDKTYKISQVWYKHLPADTRHQILQHFGLMPLVETNYISSPDGPSWLWWMIAILPIETRLKVLLVSLTSLPRRLEFLYRILLHFQSAIMS